MKPISVFILVSGSTALSVTPDVPGPGGANPLWTPTETVWNSLIAYSTPIPGTTTSIVCFLSDGASDLSGSVLPQSSLITVISSYLAPAVTVIAPVVNLSSTKRAVASAESILLESEPFVAWVVITSLPFCIA